MRPFPLLAAMIIAVLVATVAEEGWLRDGVVLLLVAGLATAVVGLNWWEFWSTRDDR